MHRPRLIGLIGLVGLMAPLLAAGHLHAQTVTPEIRVRTARITGNVPASKRFQQTLTARRPELLRCYKTARTTVPGEVGILAGDVRVTPDGKVTQVSVRKCGLPDALKTCVIKAMGTWQIPGWKAPLRVFVQLELLFQLAAKPARRALIKGGIPARLIAGTIEARLPALREACLKGATFKRHRQPRLRILTDFDGSVQTATLYGRVPRRAMRRCLITKMKTWDFPPPDNGHRTWVLYPLFPTPQPRKPSRQGMAR